MDRRALDHTSLSADKNLNLSSLSISQNLREMALPKNIKAKLKNMSKFHSSQ
jgi:hypothetical protein